MQPRHEQFADLFILCQDRVYAYVVSLLARRADAEEVFQQTSMILSNRSHLNQAMGKRALVASGLQSYRRTKGFPRSARLGAVPRHLLCLQMMAGGSQYGTRPMCHPH